MSGAALLASWDAAKTRGLTQKEHAEEIGLPVSKYQSRLYRARAAQETAAQQPDNVPTLPGPPSQEEITLTPGDDGSLDISSYGTRITSIPQLITACRVDLEAYNLGPGDVRKWDVVLKQLDGTPNIVEAFYVSSKLIPKVIEASRLDILPVKIDARARRPERARKASGRGLIIPDTQFGFRRDVYSGRLAPFHDRAALDVVLQIAQADKVDRVTWLGDILDCSEMSDKFVREPGFYFTTQPAIYEAHWWMQQFVKAAPDADHDALEGNHDLRLPLALYNHALAMHNLQPAAANVKMPSMSVPALLSMAELGVRYIDGYPNNETWQGPVRVIHGDIARNAPGSTAAALAASSQEPVVQGHIHRIETASRTISIRGAVRTIQAVSPGCLCRLDYVVPGHKRGQQWQQGLAVVEWDGDDYAITPIPIRDGIAIYKGQRFTARPRLDDLNADTARVRQDWQF